MKINPWDKNQDIAGLTPETTVYTLKLSDWQIPEGLLCDQAWTTRDETGEHFWVRHPDHLDPDATVEVVEMPLGRFIEIQAEERGMNPFWDLARDAFLARWREMHPLTMGG